VSSIARQNFNIYCPIIILRRASHPYALNKYPIPTPNAIIAYITVSII
jgi:hypothetical protein